MLCSRIVLLCLKWMKWKVMIATGWTIPSVRQTARYIRSEGRLMHLSTWFSSFVLWAYPSSSTSLGADDSASSCKRQLWMIILSALCSSECNSLLIFRSSISGKNLPSVQVHDLYYLNWPLYAWPFFTWRLTVSARIVCVTGVISRLCTEGGSYNHDGIPKIT